jgi:hypothetical protein
MSCSSAATIPPSESKALIQETPQVQCAAHFAQELPLLQLLLVPRLSARIEDFFVCFVCLTPQTSKPVMATNQGEEIMMMFHWSIGVPWSSYTLLVGFWSLQRGYMKSPYQCIHDHPLLWQKNMFSTWPYGFV